MSVGVPEKDSNFTDHLVIQQAKAIGYGREALTHTLNGTGISNRLGKEALLTVADLMVRESKSANMLPPIVDELAERLAQSSNMLPELTGTGKKKETLLAVVSDCDVETRLEFYVKLARLPSKVETSLSALNELAKALKKYKF